MLERFDTDQDRKGRFTRNLISRVAMEVFDAQAEEDLAQYDFNMPEIHGLFPEYFESDKTLGTIDDESLKLLALRCMAYTNTDIISDDTKVDILELGATALWEAAFVQAVDTHNHVDSVEERLEYLHGYEVLTEYAQGLLGKKSIKYHQLELRASFTRVLKDIVCGEITMTTMNETEIALNEQLDALRSLKNSNRVQGLVGEIKVLQHYWSNYKKVGQDVAVPSTLRGNSGVFRRDETHDIDVLRQRKDRSWRVMTPVEVKKHQIREFELARYVRSLLAQVSPDGRVSITGEHRRLLPRKDEIA